MEPVSPPPGLAQDGCEQAGDLGRIGLRRVGPASAADLVTVPPGTLSAGPAAVAATAPGARPVQLGGAHRAARHPATTRARFVTHRGGHAISSAVRGTARAATMTAIAWRLGRDRPSPRDPAMTRTMTAQAIVRQLVSPGNRPITLVSRQWPTLGPCRRSRGSAGASRCGHRRIRGEAPLATRRTAKRAIAVRRSARPAVLGPV